MSHHLKLLCGISQWGLCRMCCSNQLLRYCKDMETSLRYILKKSCEGHIKGKNMFLLWPCCPIAGKEEGGRKKVCTALFLTSTLCNLWVSTWGETSLQYLLQSQWQQSINIKIPCFADYQRHCCITQIGNVLGICLPHICWNCLLYHWAISHARYWMGTGGIILGCPI